MNLETKQREILGQLYTKLGSMAAQGAALAQRGTMEEVMQHTDEMHEVIEAVQRGLEEACGASAVLARIGERAKTLSRSKAVR